MPDLDLVAISLLLLSLGVLATLGLAWWTWRLADRTADQADWLADREMDRMLDAVMDPHADDLDALNQTLGGES